VHPLQLIAPLELIQAERESGPLGKGPDDAAIVKEHKAGMKTADLCRKYGISESHLPQLESQLRRAGGLRG
jgi:hypothetical protein